MTTVHRALISVSDKAGIENFARGLSQLGIELFSTGGTHAALKKAGIPVREVSDYTGYPEMMDGRLKTLHPKVHGGILARRDEEGDRRSMEEHGIEGIELVVVNLYPFEQTVSKEGVSREEAIEKIDIGGPTMVRSAAKNHAFVGVVTDPADYGPVLATLEANDRALGESMRRELAHKAFALTARYDAAISSWMFSRGEGEESFPENFALAGEKVLELRYGENPHQKAAFYRMTTSREPSLGNAEVLSGKALSFNNLVDLDAALSLAKEFEEPFACVLKHNNPCGAAQAKTVGEAIGAAWEGDPLSAFGSVLAFNRPVDQAVADFLTSENRFVEAIIAPAFEPDAYQTLTEKPRWGRNVRLLTTKAFGAKDRDARDLELKKLVGGFLLQDRDLEAEISGECRTVTKREPSAEELEDMLFAAKIGKHVKSNAIVLAKGGKVLGVGAGQMSRVDSVHLAIRKAGEEVRGSVLASDAFFPFPDGPEEAIQAGVTALLQPGGSMRDDAVIEACDRLGASMVLSGRRHFRH